MITITEHDSIIDALKYVIKEVYSSSNCTGSVKAWKQQYINVKCKDLIDIDIY